MQCRRIHHHPAPHLLDKEGFLETGGLRDHTATVIHDEGTAGVHGVIIATQGLHAGEPNTRPLDLGTKTALRHRGDGRGRWIGHVKAIHREEDDHIAPVWNGIEVARGIEGGSYPRAGNFEDRGAPWRYGQNLLMPYHREAQGNDAALPQHENLEQLTRLECENGGRQARHSQVVGDAGEALQDA